MTLRVMPQLYFLSAREHMKMEGLKWDVGHGSETLRRTNGVCIFSLVSPFLRSQLLSVQWYLFCTSTRVCRGRGLKGDDPYTAQFSHAGCFYRKQNTSRTGLLDKN